MEFGWRGRLAQDREGLTGLCRKSPAVLLLCQLPAAGRTKMQHQHNNGKSPGQGLAAAGIASYQAQAFARPARIKPKLTALRTRVYHGTNFQHPPVRAAVQHRSDSHL
ncbi:hypothetical protein, partial [Leisingera sp. F5]|uniref:hypothetical protein n=1 Tax=Leisingera sp. F5 TaxID=1813816 RepID=UPI0025BAE2D9